jgi:membrane fusion protein (multidrug efflux system)
MSEVRRIHDEERVAPVQEAPAAAPSPANGTPSPQPRRRRPSRTKRILLLFGLPALVVFGASYVYVAGGRYVDTDNAYVKADKAIISAQVSGKIVAVDVSENQRVATGAPLFRLDPAPFQLALEHADAVLAQTKSDIAALKVAYRQALAEIDLAKTNVAYAKIEQNRQTGLVAHEIGSVSDLDDARHRLETTQKQVEVARQRADKILIDLGGDPNIPIEAHPRYRQAAASRAQAALDLEHCVVKAPFAGVVSKKPEIGTYVERGAPVMSLVADSAVWVEANFKETQLTHLRPGQSATIEVDTYPGRKWHGRVQSISEATGSEFAVLPAQNATGNWVKVVQRVAVRIALPHDPADPPRRAGMSATVTVDTEHHRSVGDLLPWS